MLAILSAPGSRGDVNPMIAIGQQLRERGFDVVITLAEPYAPVARRVGLIPEAVISQSQFDELLADPSVWRPVSGVRAIFRDVVAKFLTLHYEVIQRHHRPGETVLVAHPLDYASRTYRDAFPQTPLASIVLAPAVLRNRDHPPRLSPWWFEPHLPAWANASAYFLGEHFVINPHLAPPLNALRASLGLDRVTRPLESAWLSPDCVALMYPSWFAPESGPSDRRTFFAGFPLAEFDEGPVELQVDEPIVFTFGTAHRHSKQLFAQAIAAVQQLKRCGVLLTQHPENLPKHLPPGIQAITYASLPALLRQSTAIVHHGGIGTTSQSLAAGIPQLIRPMAFDQFDNAARVQRLGVGRWLRSPNRLVAELDFLINSPDVRDRCQSTASTLENARASNGGAALAADAIQKLCTSRCAG